MFARVAVALYCVIRVQEKSIGAVAPAIRKCLSNTLICNNLRSLFLQIFTALLHGRAVCYVSCIRIKINRHNNNVGKLDIRVSTVKAKKEGEYLMSLSVNSNDFALTMEQEFSLVCYNQQINGISQEELQIALLEITRQLMIKDNLIKALVKARI